MVDHGITGLGEGRPVEGWALGGRLGFGVRWIRHHPWIFGALVVNLAFLFLPFYDSNNVPFALAVTSHFNSAVPPSSYNHWVAGIFIYAAYVPGHLAYVASGFQIYWTFTIFKAIYFGLTLWMAYALYHVFGRRSATLAEAMAALVIVNPIWLFVSYIWTEYDIIPVAFIAVGYLVLRYWNGPPSDHRRILFAVALLAVSVFFYWYALALVPTLLYYSASNRERALLLAYATAIFGSLFAITVLVFSGSPAGYVGALAGANTALNRSNFFGFQFFVPLAQTEYLALAAAIVVLLPLVLRKFRLSEPATAFVVLTLFVFTNSVPMPDNYVFVFPFALLSFLNWRAGDTRLRWLWALLSYPLVGLTLFNVFVTNAQPDGIGVFFFGYDLFRSNPHVLFGDAALRGFLLVFNIAVVAAILFSFAVLAIMDRRRPEHAPVPAYVPRPPQRAVLPRPVLITPRRAVLAGTTILAVTAVALAFNLATPNLVSYGGSGPAPIYLMTPFFVPSNGNVVRPIPGQTFTADGPTIEIPSAAPPLVFGRWFSTESVEIAGGVALGGYAPRMTLAIDAVPFPVSILNESMPSLGGGAAVATTGGQGARAAGGVDIPLNPGLPAYYFDGNASREYTLSEAAWLAGSYTVVFDPLNRSNGQTVVVCLNGVRDTLTVASAANGTALVYSGWSTGNRTVARNLFGALGLDEWGFVSFRPSATGVSFDVNGLWTNLSLPIFSTGSLTTLTVGRPPFYGSRNNTFDGYTSELYRTSRAPPITDAYGYTVPVAGGFVNGSLGSPAISFDLFSTRGATHLVLDGTQLSSTQQTTIFAFGKWYAGPYNVTLTLSKLTMRQVAPDRFYLVPVFWAAAAPFLLVGASLLVLREVLGGRGGGRSPAVGIPPGGSAAHDG